MGCKYCDNAVQGKKCSDNVAEDRVCSAQNGGTASCQSKWANEPKTLQSTGCSNESAPAHADQCGNQKCVNKGRGNIYCFCAGTGNNKCNHPATYPAPCDPHDTSSAEPPRMERMELKERL